MSKKAIISMIVVTIIVWGIAFGINYLMNSEYLLKHTFLLSGILIPLTYAGHSTSSVRMDKSFNNDVERKFFPTKETIVAIVIGLIFVVISIFI